MEVAEGKSKGTGLGRDSEMQRVVWGLQLSCALVTSGVGMFCEGVIVSQSGIVELLNFRCGYSLTRLCSSIVHMMPERPLYCCPGL